MVSINPLALFSDQPKNNTNDGTPESSGNAEDDEPQGIVMSSPVQTEETLLLDKYTDLLQLRNELKKEVEILEIKWNEKHTLEMMNMEQEKNEEQNLILQLLLQSEDDIKNQGDESEQVISNDEDISDISDSDDDATPPPEKPKENLITFDPSEYDARPLRDWSLRIPYLKKLYPYLTISEYDSRLSINYQDHNKVFKIISFKVSYGNLITVRVKLDLDQVQETMQEEQQTPHVKESYNLQKLSVERVSNNSLNGILNKLINAHESQRNINSFLVHLNTLYEYLMDRFKLISTLSEEFNQKELDTSDMLINELEYIIPRTKTPLIILWDLAYDTDDHLFDVSIIANLENSLLQKLHQVYGELEGTRKFIETMSDIV